jgi:Galactose oxidase, central domain
LNNTRGVPVFEALFVGFAQRLCLVLFLGTSCQFEAALPAESLISCGPNLECPPRYRCISEVKECRLIEAAGDVPVLTMSLPNPARVRVGNMVGFEISSSLPLRQAPALLLRSGARSLSGPLPILCSAGFRQCTFSFTIEAALSDGFVFVLADAVSTSGASLVGAKLEGFEVDNQAPSVLRMDARIKGPVGCPLSRVSQVGPGAQHEFEFTVSEPLSQPPTVTAGNLVWDIVPQPSSGNVYVFHIDIPLGTPSQRLPAQVELVDQVGNRAQRELQPMFEIDSQPPAELVESDQEKLTYQRVPWGCAETNDETRYSVSGSPGLLQSGESLVYYESGAVGAEVLGQASAQSDGNIGRTIFSKADRAQIWALRYDGACNTGSKVPQLIRRGEWVATFGTPSGSPPNPNLCNLRSDSAQAANNLTPLVQRTDWSKRGQPAIVEQREQYQFNSLNELPKPAALEDRTLQAMAYDPLRRRLVVFGGQGRSGPLNDTWVLSALGWTQLTPPAGLSARDSATMAYDFGRGQLVLFGGKGLGNRRFSDTWVLGDSGWSELPTPASLPARFIHAMAYDFSRHQLVLYGGSGDSGPLSDTWVLGANTWTPLPTTLHPPARYNTTLTFDLFSKRLVLCGGYGDAPLSDTWVLSPTGWIQLPTPSGFIGRFFHAVAFDESRQRLVLFGGADATGRRDDTWILEAQGWVPLSTLTKPLSRSQHTLVFDRQLGHLVLFGGENAGISLNDTWVLQGTGWTQLAPQVGLVPRKGHSMAFDFNRQALVALGGESGPNVPLSAVQILKSGRWNPLDEPGAPAARAYHTMAYDENLQQMVMLAGSNLAGFLNDSWALRNNAWVPIATPNAFVPRQDHAMAYDRGRGHLVAFGGKSFGGTLNDTWTLESSGWAALPSSALPPTRFQHAMAYDGRLKRLVLFGGSSNANGTGWLNDTWTLEASGWTPLASTNTPPPRSNAAMTFDEKRGQMILFGGESPSGFLNDTWALGPSGWVEISSPATLAPRSCTALTYDETRGQLVLFGGCTSNMIFGDTWTLSSTGWMRLNIPSPAARFHHTLTYDAARRKLVLLGGVGFQGPLRDVWTLDLNGWHQELAPTEFRERFSHRAAFDTANHRLVAMGGLSRLNPPDFMNETWMINPSSVNGPANVFIFNIGQGLPASASVVSLTSTVSAAALGFVADGGVGALASEIAGARLDAWDWATGLSRPLAAHSVSPRTGDGGVKLASDGAPIAAQVADLTATLHTDAGWFDGFDNGLWRFQVSARGGAQNDARRFTPAELSVEYVEVKMNYVSP